MCLLFLKIVLKWVQIHIKTQLLSDICAEMQEKVTKTTYNASLYDTLCFVPLCLPAPTDHMISFTSSTSFKWKNKIMCWKKNKNWTPFVNFAMCFSVFVTEMKTVWKWLWPRLFSHYPSKRKTEYWEFLLKIHRPLTTRCVFWISRKSFWLTF